MIEVLKIMCLISDSVFKNSASDSKNSRAYAIPILRSAVTGKIFIDPSREGSYWFFFFFFPPHQKYPADIPIGRFLSKQLDGSIQYSITKKISNIPFPVYFLESCLCWIPRQLFLSCVCVLKCVMKRIFCHNIVDVICLRRQPAENGRMRQTDCRLMSFIHF